MLRAQLIAFFLWLNFFNTVSGQTNTPRFTPEEKNWSEYDLTGWHFGINMGMYHAARKTAAFYNGAPGNENTIAYVLNNYYWYNEIFKELNSRKIFKNPSEIPPAWAGAYNQWREIYNVATGDTTKWWIYYPVNLKYNMAVSPGFYARYNFNNTTGVFLQSNYVKLRTSGIFQMVIDSVTGFSEPALRPGYIRGEEERINIDIGISKIYRIGEITNILLEAGFHLNSTQVLSNEITIGTKKYSIINIYLNQTYVPNTNLTTYNVYQGGLGYGMFVTGGLRFIFSENLSLEPAAELYWKTIQLKPYNDPTLNWMIFVRLIFDLF